MTTTRRLLPALLFAVACSSAPTEESRPPVVVVSLDQAALSLGDLLLPTVRVTTDGVTRLASVSEFGVTSSDPSVVEVTPEHFLAARKEGSVTITVSLGEMSAARTVTVAPPDFVALRMYLPTALIPRDSGAVAFTGYTRGGATITSLPTLALTSRSGAVLVVNNTLVVAADTGTSWVVARTPDGATDSVLVSVTFGAPTQLTIAPHTTTLDVGSSLTMTSLLVDRRRNALNLPVQFTSTNGAVVSVSNAGVVTGRGAGTAMVIANWAGLADTLVATVTGAAAPPVDPVVPPPPPPPPPTGSTPGITVTPPGAYVQVRITGSPTPSVVTAFTNAAAKLNAMLRSNGGVYSVPLLIPPGACAETQPLIDETVNGLLIMASVGPIDGPSNILGYAGPCLVRSGARGLPVLGVMVFDETDMQLMANNNILGGVVLHEMVHVLGIGTLWGPSWQGWVADPYGANPRFTGMSGSAQYSLLDLLDGANGVPVENTGGSGTRGGHWRESVFQTELMTGWAGGAMAMSRVTVGALGDMGYDVDLSRADAYGLPGGLSGIMERGMEIVDRAIMPIGRVDRAGKVDRD